jgi:multidrug efflux system outer membrane protein
MKTSANIFLVSLTILSVLAQSTDAHAWRRRVPRPDTSACDPTVAPESTGTEPTDVAVEINPETLRNRILHSNVSLMIQANKVHQAKDQINIARGRLFPSINLGTLLLTGGGPTFALGAVEFLLPFLLPTRWFEFFQAKHLMRAEKVAYRILKVNMYASASSLYYQVLNDQDLKRILRVETDHLRKIQSLVESQYQAGISPIEDLERARAQRALAEINESKVQDLVIQEIATLRHLLAEKTTAEFTLQPTVLPMTYAEELGQEKTETLALEKSLELEQMIHLRSSARLEKWKKIFGFLSKSTLSNSNPSAGMSFSNLIGGMGFNFGFDYFPSIRLTQHNLQELSLRAEEVKYESNKTVETAMKQITEAMRRYDLARSAEVDATHVFQTKLSLYELGVETLFSALESRALLRQAQVEALQATTQVNVLRVSLNRILLADEFEKIEECAAF